MLSIAPHQTTKYSGLLDNSRGEFRQFIPGNLAASQQGSVIPTFQGTDGYVIAPEVHQTNFFPDLIHLLPRLNP